MTVHQELTFVQMVIACEKQTQEKFREIPQKPLFLVPGDIRFYTS